MASLRYAHALTFNRTNLWMSGIVGIAQFIVTMLIVWTSQAEIADERITARSFGENSFYLEWTGGQLVSPRQPASDFVHLGDPSAPPLEVTLEYYWSFRISDPDVWYGLFREYSDDRLAAQQGYRLANGRWPQRPGEVVATANVVSAISSDNARTLPGEVVVVGELVDSFDYSNGVIIGASGTAASWEGPDLTVRFPTFQFGLRAYFSADPSSLVFPENLALHSRSDSSKGVTGSQSVRTSVRLAVPLVGIGALMACLMMVARRSWIRRVFDLLTQTGTTVGQARAILAIGLGSLAGAAMACALGLALAVAVLAEGAIARAVGHDLGNAGSAVLVSTGAALGTVIIVVLGVFFVTQRRTKLKKSDPKAGQLGRFGESMEYCAIAVGAVAVVVAMGAKSAIGASVACGLAIVAIAMVSPRILGIRRPDPLSERFPVQVARRHVKSNPAPAITMFVAGLLVAAPFAMQMVINQSVGDTYVAGETYPPAKGQVLIAAPEGAALDAAVSAVSDATGGQATITKTNYVTGSDLTTPVGLDAEGFGPIIVFANVAELEQGVGATLTPTQRELLESGAVLVPANGDTSVVDAQGRVTLRAHSGTPVPDEVASVPAFFAVVRDEWTSVAAAFAVDGFQDAEGLGLVPAQTYALGVTDAQATAARESLTRSGFDSALVRSPRIPDGARAIANFAEVARWVFEAIAFLLAFGASVVVVRSWHIVGARMVAIGAPPQWVVSLVARVTLIPFLKGVVAGLIASVGPMIMAFGSQPDALSFPLVQTGAAIAGAALLNIVCLAWFGSTLHPSRRLGPT